MHPYTDKSDDLPNIPKEFYSEETGKLFTNCLVCNCNLLSGKILYIIEKAVKQYPKYKTHDIIFEYAICIDCAESMKNQLSTESQENIHNYFTNHIEQSYADNLKSSPNSKNDVCFFKGTAKNNLNEYQLCSMCIGEKIIPHQIPYLVGSEAIEEMAELLSNQTLDNMDRFIDTYLGVPAVLKDILKENKVYLL